MADLDVQPKKNNSWWLWLLLLLIALGLLFFFLRGCNNKNANQASNSDSTASNSTDGTANNAVATTTPADGNQIDFNSPKEAYEEVTDTSISVRGNKDYTIYGLGEDVLFDKDKNTIKSSAETQLKLIAASLNKRFKGADLSVYGHTDSTGTTAHNKELGGERAEAVRSWFVKNGIIADKIAVHSFGETNPVASNGTAEGRQQNRSVAIVAMPTKPSGNQ
jgi:outer membrane protein OmpA-like peptidoglycan-associated protein